MTNPSESRQRLSVLAVLLLTALAGCASNQRSRLLADTLNRYESAVRWGNFGAAATYLRPEDIPSRQRLNFMLQRFEQVRITGYRPVSRAPGPNEDTVIQVVQLRLANRHTAREREIVDRQVWKWDEEAGRWWLISGLPDISRK